MKASAAPPKLVALVTSLYKGGFWLTGQGSVKVRYLVGNVQCSKGY
jgi:hypothetical protein